MLQIKINVSDTKIKADRVPLVPVKEKNKKETLASVATNTAGNIQLLSPQTQQKHSLVTAQTSSFGRSEPCECSGVYELLRLQKHTEDLL